jgi:hypothetical protein
LISLVPNQIASGTCGTVMRHVGIFEASRSDQSDPQSGPVIVTGEPSAKRPESPGMIG